MVYKWAMPVIEAEYDEDLAEVWAEITDAGEFFPSWTIPPGDHIQEIIEGLGLDHYELSEKLGILPIEARHLLDGRLTLNEDLAHRLESAFGRPARYWIALEFNHRKDLMRLRGDVVVIDKAELKRTFANSFHRQDRKERNRRMAHVILLVEDYLNILQMSVQGNLLARGAIEAVIEGDWNEVRRMAADWQTREGLEHLGVSDSELQTRWNVFARRLQYAAPIETRHGSNPAM